MRLPGVGKVCASEQEGRVTEMRLAGSLGLN